MGSVINALPNYTGPYISNGEFQTSVEFGDKQPKDKLDELSRLHDSAYAKYGDYGHRTAADVIYKREADKLIGLFPELAGFAVKYGNQFNNSLGTIGKDLLSYGPLGLITGGVKNAFRLHDYMLNGEKYKNEINDYYKTDPGFNTRKPSGKPLNVMDVLGVPIGKPKIPSKPPVSLQNNTVLNKGEVLPQTNVYNPYHSRKNFQSINRYRGRRKKFIYKNALVKM